MKNEKEKITFAPEEAKEQLRLRALHNHLISIALDSQDFNKWDDATTFAMLACYQSDMIEKLSQEVTALRSAQPIRYIMSSSTGFSFKQWDGFQIPESRPTPKSLNINDYVWVKLTDKGREMWKDLWKETSPNGIPPERLARHAAGDYMRFQLHEVANIFGPRLAIGYTPLPLETEIFLEDPNPTTPCEFCDKPIKKCSTWGWTHADGPVQCGGDHRAHLATPKGGSDGKG